MANEHTYGDGLDNLPDMRDELERLRDLNVKLIETLHRAELTLHEMSRSKAIHSVHRNILRDVAKGLRTAIEAAMGEA